MMKQQDMEATAEKKQIIGEIEMLDSRNATDGLRHNVGRERTPDETSGMFDVNDLAKFLKCSPRHVYRLAETEQMPRPVKLGWLVRWPKVVIQDWINRGCPGCRDDGGNHE